MDCGILPRGQVSIATFADVCLISSKRFQSLLLLRSVFACVTVACSFTSYPHKHLYITNPFPLFHQPKSHQNINNEENAFVKTFSIYLFLLIRRHFLKQKNSHACRFFLSFFICTIIMQYAHKENPSSVRKLCLFIPSE